jgi:hypothetical protein
MTKRTYTFDAPVLPLTVRISAESEAEARAKLHDISGIDLILSFDGGPGEGHIFGEIIFTEGEKLVGIDGEGVA